MDDPADSVFCSHGSGDIVKWNEVFDHMHIGSVLEAREKKNESSADGYSDELLANEALNEERKRKGLHELPAVNPINGGTSTLARKDKSWNSVFDFFRKLVTGKHS